MKRSEYWFRLGLGRATVGQDGPESWIRIVAHLVASPISVVCLPFRL